MTSFYTRTLLRLLKKITRSQLCLSYRNVS